MSGEEPFRLPTKIARSDNRATRSRRKSLAPTDFISKTNRSFRLQLDAKKSPLALLAQTCSAIGADTPNPKLISAAEKAGKSHRDRPPTAEGPRERSPETSKPSFKPYESCLARDKTSSPDERPATVGKVGTPVPATGPPGPPAPRCPSNQSGSSQRASPRRRTPDTATPPRSSPIIAPVAATAPPAPRSPPTGFKPTGAYSGSSFPLPLELMAAAQQHALKAGLAPYLYAHAHAHARLRPQEACRDPYCGCSLLRAAPCPAGCAHCEPGKQHYQQLAALAQLPYACSWVGGGGAGGETYCGKRFASSDELLQHLRAHTAGSPLLSRGYLAPMSPLSQLSPRFHPYSKPPLPPQLPFPLPPHSLAAYFAPYPLFGPRVHP